MGDSKKFYGCCACLSSGTGIILGLIFMGITGSSLLFLNPDKHECQISNVTYPVSIPTNPLSIHENFVTCDCGKNCISDLGYCVRIYVNTMNESYLAGLYGSLDKGCTFAETKCSKGENMLNRINALQRAATIAEPYIHLMNTTKTIHCYTSNNYIFLQDDSNSIILKMSVTGGTSMLLLLLSCLCCKAGDCFK